MLDPFPGSSDRKGRGDMERIRIQIQTKDTYYGSVLQRVLTRHYRGFVVQVTDELGKTTGHFDLRLTDEKEAAKDGVILLVETPAEEDLDERAVPRRLFKYTTARQMAGKLLKLAGEKRGHIIRAGEEGTVYAVAASRGGAGCTTLALALAGELAMAHGAEVLFLSMEQILSGASRPGSAGGTAQDLREHLLRYLDEEAPPDPSPALWRDDRGVYRFTHSAGENPLISLEGDVMTAWVSHVIGSLGITHVVADTGNLLTEASCALIRGAERLLFIVGEEARDRDHLSVLAGEAGMGVYDQIIRIESETEETEGDVEIPDDTGKREESAPPSFRIPREERIDPAGDSGVIDRSGLFGSAVGRLVNRLERERMRED